LFKEDLFKFKEDIIIRTKELDRMKDHQTFFMKELDGSIKVISISLDDHLENYTFFKNNELEARLEDIKLKLKKGIEKIYEDMIVIESDLGKIKQTTNSFCDEIEVKMRAKTEEILNRLRPSANTTLSPSSNSNTVHFAREEISKAEFNLLKGEVTMRTEDSSHLKQQLLNLE